MYAELTRVGRSGAPGPTVPGALPAKASLRCPSATSHPDPPVICWTQPGPRPLPLPYLHRGGDLMCRLAFRPPARSIGRLRSHAERENKNRLRIPNLKSQI